MRLISIDGKTPTVASSTWIAPSATIVGDVSLRDDVSVFYGAVLRAAV